MGEIRSLLKIVWLSLTILLRWILALKPISLTLRYLLGQHLLRLYILILHLLWHLLKGIQIDLLLKQGKLELLL